MLNRLVAIIIAIIALLILIFFAMKVIAPKIFSNLDIIRNLLPITLILKNNYHRRWTNL